MTRSLASRTTMAVFLLALVAVPRDAGADVFVAPHLAWAFNSEYLTKSPQGWGVTFGATGAFVGFEVDWTRTNDFFADEELEIEPAAATDDRVQTLMFNLLITVPTGRAKPYFAFGAGVIQSRLRSELAELGFEGNGVGFNFGGGILGYFGSHIGVRADIRRFRSVTDLFKDNILDIDFGGLSYWQGSLGLALKF